MVPSYIMKFKNIRTAIDEDNSLETLNQDTINGGKWCYLGACGDSERTGGGILLGAV